VSDPRRLLGGDGTEFERLLLGAGKNERMPADLKLRMQEGLGLSGGSGAASAGGAAAAAGGKASFILWLSVGILAVGFGGGVLGGRLFARPVPAAPPAPRPEVTAPAAPSAPAVAAPALGPAPAALATADVELAVVKRAQAHKVRSRPVASLRGDLRAEIGLIDAAREALVMHAPGEALEILQRYGARFPHGTFTPEAVALRVEALEQSGAHREAQSQAREFAATHPDSPLVERINRLVR
jgi:hypothetical protein